MLKKPRQTTAPTLKSILVPESKSSDELIGMQQIFPFSVCVTHQDHLLYQLAVRIPLGDNLPEDKEHQEILLEHVIPAGQDKPFDGHGHAGRLLSIQDHVDGFAQVSLL